MTRNNGILGIEFEIAIGLLKDKVMSWGDMLISGDYFILCYHSSIHFLYPEVHVHFGTFDTDHYLYTLSIFLINQRSNVSPFYIFF